MARGQSAIIDPLRRLIGRQGGCTLSDAELLERFVSQKDAASFEVLVWRHGLMVLGLCKRLLRDEHEAEDAFQATFLVLSRKAGSVGRGEAVGSRLYKVAYRVSLRLRDAAAKRPVAAGDSLNEPADSERPDDFAWQELRPVLDHEIAGLPEKYRAPFVLCYLQGRTNEEAAEQLGCPKGTVLSRLARGREWLRNRLSRRGLAPAAVALAMNLPATVSASVPNVLAQSTVAVAIPFATGTALASSHVVNLAEGVIRAMIVTKLKAVAAGLVALAVLGSGLTLAAFEGGQDRNTPAATPAQERAAPQDRERGAPADRAPEAGQPPRDVQPAIVGKVVAVAKDGKSFTVEFGGVRERGQARAEPEQRAIKVTDKTGSLYSDVLPNGATPTVGYAATIWLAENTKDVATFVTFFGNAGGRNQADVFGLVSSVAKDGKSIVVEVPPARDAGRDAEPKKVTINFDAKTTLRFSNVNKGGATPTVGQRAGGWYADDGATAGLVNLTSTADPERREEKRPELRGKVLAAVEGKSITLEVPAAERGAEPQKVEVSLTDKTVLNFTNVPLDGTKLAEGMQAWVWLADNSKDTATKINVTGNVPERWATVSGKVAAVGKDGNSFTIEIPGANPRTDEPTKIEVKMTPKTQITYSGIGAGQAKPAEGLHATVKLLEDSKDTAKQVIFTKAGPVRGR